VTLYLLDANVLQEMHPAGHANVRTWLNGVDDNQLRLSVVTIHENRVGLERERLRREAKGKDASAIVAKLAALDALADAYGARLLPVDRAVADEWARLLAAKGKNDRDMALAATARVHNLVLVTRNIRDFAGRGVMVLDPFSRTPAATLA